MYKQQSFYDDPDKIETIKTAKHYLETIYQKKRHQMFMLEPHLQSAQLSADKIQTSRSNSTEDKLLHYLDTKNELADCENALKMLFYMNRPILKILYMDDYGSNTDIMVAKKLNLTTKTRDSYITVANATYFRHKDQDYLAFADLFNQSKYKIILE
ncbi:MAG: hypothetical protein ABF750_04010 [Oenococcus oeni]